MQVETLPNGLLGASCYIVHDAARALVVDSGCASVDELLRPLASMHVSPDYILLTHEHFDHSRQAEVLRRETGARLVCAAECAAALRDPRRNFSLYWGDPFTIKNVDVIVEAPSCDLEWAGGTVRVLATPGHTPGSVCFQVGDRLFSGDTLLLDNRKRARIPGSDKELQDRSALHLITTLSPEVVVYPGHGEPFRMGMARDRLRCGDQRLFSIPPP